MLQIYKASAGSGKTYTLAREYIRLLLSSQDQEGNQCLDTALREAPGTRHRRILAITFTNKATEEMKSRIVSALHRLANPRSEKKETYAEYLEDQLHCTPEDLQTASRNALDGLLLDFQWFSVSTIDSFFQHVLRSFAREVGLRGRYNLELENQLVYTQAIDALLSDVNHQDRDATIAEWVKSQIREKEEGGSQFNIFNRTTTVYKDLVRFVTDVTNEKFSMRQEEILDYISDPQQLLTFSQALKRKADHLRQAAAEACCKALEIIDKYPDVAINKHITNPLGKATEKDKEIKSYSDTVKKGIEEISTIYNKPKGNKEKVLIPEINDAVEAALNTIKEWVETGRFLTNVRSQLHGIGLLGKIMGYVKDLRTRDDIVLLSDTVTMLHDILGDCEQDAPFVYERIGVRYHHYLIDEFQDTSAMQWDNIRPLVSESLSNANDDLVIGDVKQSIYRFRNSDSTLLQGLGKDDEFARRQAVEIHGETLEENTNWRSSRHVVEFNNALYSALSGLLGFSDEYQGVEQQVSPKHKDHQGYVRVEAYGSPATKGKKKGADDDAAQTDQENPADPALEILTTQLRRQLESGYSPCDIAVLVRQNKEATKVSEHLMKDFPGLKIATDEALLLHQSPSVRLIISVLRYLALGLRAPQSKAEDPQRKLARLLNAFEYSMNQGVDPSLALPAAVESVSQQENEAAKTAGEIGDMDCPNLTSIVERIIIRYLSEKDRNEQNVFLAAFQDLVTDFSRFGSCDIAAFLQYWDTKGDKLKVSASADVNAINVLTIHKAKGLEYRCVHIPYAAFPYQSRGVSREWFDTGEAFPDLPQVGDKDVKVPPMLPLELKKEMGSWPIKDQYQAFVREHYLDTLNLTYVATTRAKDELCISLPKTCKESTIGADLLKVMDKAGMSMDDKGVYESGNPTRPSDFQDDDKDKDQVIQSEPMPPYASHERRDLWKGTQLETLEEPTGALERGVMMHALLSRVETRDDAPRTLKAMTNTGEMTPEQRKEYGRLLMKAVNDPQAAQWFDGYKRVLLERPIVDENGDTHRPDRVVWTAQGTVDVVDYKFGRHYETEYATQVREYMALLTRAGHDNVRGFLWYPLEQKIEQVYQQ